MEPDKSRVLIGLLAAKLIQLFKFMQQKLVMKQTRNKALHKVLLCDAVLELSATMHCLQSFLTTTTTVSGLPEERKTVGCPGTLALIAKLNHLGIGTVFLQRTVVWMAVVTLDLLDVEYIKIDIMRLL